MTNVEEIEWNERIYLWKIKLRFVQTYFIIEIIIIQIIKII